MGPCGDDRVAVQATLVGRFSRSSPSPLWKRCSCSSPWLPWPRMICAVQGTPTFTDLCRACNSSRTLTSASSLSLKRFSTPITRHDTPPPSAPCEGIRGPYDSGTSPRPIPAPRMASMATVRRVDTDAVSLGLVVYYPYGHMGTLLFLSPPTRQTSSRRGTSWFLHRTPGWLPPDPPVPGSPAKDDAHTLAREWAEPLLMADLLVAHAHASRWMMTTFQYSFLGKLTVISALRLARPDLLFLAHQTRTTHRPRFARHRPRHGVAFATAAQALRYTIRQADVQYIYMLPAARYKVVDVLALRVPPSAACAHALTMGAVLIDAASLPAERDMSHVPPLLCISAMRPLMALSMIRTRCGYTGPGGRHTTFHSRGVRHCAVDGTGNTLLSGRNAPSPTGLTWRTHRFLRWHLWMTHTHIIGLIPLAPCGFLRPRPSWMGSVLPLHA